MKILYYIVHYLCHFHILGTIGIANGKLQGPLLSLVISDHHYYNLFSTTITTNIQQPSLLQASSDLSFDNHCSHCPPIIILKLPTLQTSLDNATINVLLTTSCRCPPSLSPQFPPIGSISIQNRCFISQYFIHTNKKNTIHNTIFT